jgi:hypothetical protein
MHGAVATAARDAVLDEFDRWTFVFETPDCGQAFRAEGSGWSYAPAVETVIGEIDAHLGQLPGSRGVRVSRESMQCFVLRERCRRLCAPGGSLFPPPQLPSSDAAVAGGPSGPLDFLLFLRPGSGAEGVAGSAAGSAEAEWALAAAGEEPNSDSAESRPKRWRDAAGADGAAGGAEGGRAVGGELVLFDWEEAAGGAGGAGARGRVLRPRDGTLVVLEQGGLWELSEVLPGGDMLCLRGRCAAAGARGAVARGVDASGRDEGEPASGDADGPIPIGGGRSSCAGASDASASAEEASAAEEEAEEASAAEETEEETAAEETEEETAEEETEEGAGWEEEGEVSSAYRDAGNLAAVRSR